MFHPLILKTMCNKVFALLIVAFLIAACGSPKTLIRVTNKADGTDTHISVEQGGGGSTSVTVNPSVNASLDSINFVSRR